jgi:molybdopterin-guanine dinucleotide biosynthesis protein A
MNPESIAGLVLAGGAARRLGGGDKVLLPLAGETLLARIVARLKPQCARLVVNAGGDPERFAAYGLPVAADTVGDGWGPLAGILCGIDWAAAHAPQVTHVLSVPGDAPFLPADLAKRLGDALERDATVLATAVSAGQTHHVTGLWPVHLRHDLRAALTVEGLRKVDVWASRFSRSLVAWPVDGTDPFFNVNTSDDLAAAEAILRRGP